MALHLESFGPPWRPGLAFLHRSIPSALMTPKPPQVLLGSVQDAARSALSNGTGQASSQQGFT